MEVRNQHKFLQNLENFGKHVRQLIVPKYGLPDKNVASQILMYRQLLHTKCKPGLKLSRAFQGTPAQVAVMNMPWWTITKNEAGERIPMSETGKMVIEYDHLVTRLWNASTQSNDAMAPIPNQDWVDQVGFQQPDPVTDFRSGGVLSLALMLWIAESSHVFRRFQHCVLPFGITSINITDMLAKFLMLSKSTDRMEALLSQKPFWNMFSDPSSILHLQEIALDTLCDVVDELQTTNRKKVTVFDFAEILSITEHRVEFDLLGAGPRTVTELHAIHQRLKQQRRESIVTTTTTTPVSQEQQQQQQQQVSTTTTEAQPPTTLTDDQQSQFQIEEDDIL